MERAMAALSGVLFGIGVTLSGMVNPMKVQNFMDILGAWDPTLLFVMGAGLAVSASGFRLLLRRPKPLFAASFHLPKARAADARLIGGSALFGIGWGLTGFCPGPAIASLVFGYWPSLLFVVFMAIGMLLASFTTARNGA